MPKIQLPTIAPIEKYDPIHDVCDKVIGPPINGESSDCNFGKFGLSQPIANPWQRLIILAESKKSQPMIFNKTK